MAHPYTSPSQVVAVLASGLLLAVSGLVVYLHNGGAAAGQGGGIALSPSLPTPDAGPYTMAVGGESELRDAISAFASSAGEQVVFIDDPRAADISLEWSAGGSDPQLQITREALALSVPMADPVFSLTEDEFRRVVTDDVDDWSDVGGGEGRIELTLAAGGAAAIHGFPTAVDAGNRVDAVFSLHEGMATDRRAVRVDGVAPGQEGYSFPVSMTLAVHSQRAQELALEMAEALRAATGEPSLTLAAVGDLMMANVISSNMEALGPDQPFELMAPYLRQADITFGNLECALTERGEAAPKNYTFRSPPHLAGSLVNAGFDVLSVASNHTMDYGPVGLADTLQTLDDLGIPYSGAGANETQARAPAVLEANGLRVGFLSYVNVGQEIRSGYVNETAAAGPDRPGVAWARPDDVEADVNALRDDVDVVVVSMHIGTEGSFELREWQTETAHAAIDAGADLVLGHHAHVLQRVEHYGGGVIIFGLGNFVFDVGIPDRNNTRSVVSYFELTADGVRGYDFVPARIDVRQNRPRPLLDASGVPHLHHLLGLDELPPDPVPSPTPTPTPSVTPTATPG
ncbi:MAG: hypothetical protein GEU28_04160 [Dehalococcoidia bacterium]|nr:hypothetical protein [Dehalococcoidia bacterium]